MTFVLRNNHFGVCLDILESAVEFGRPVGVYRFVHGGKNQLWSWTRGKLMSALDADLCLGVDARGVVVLARPSEPRTNWLRTADGLIVCADAKDMAITCIGGCSSDQVVVRQTSGEALQVKPRMAFSSLCNVRALCANHDAYFIFQVWTEEQWDNSPRPACSCHLTYLGLTSSDVSAHKWTLQCSVRVRETADSTYFCVVGWAPGGYSGIQQIDPRRRVAIFSMWNDGTAEGSVSLVRSAIDVKVSAFGNEGTGLKSMKEVHWREDDLVTFIVEGVREDAAAPSPLQTWTCSCWYTLGAEKHFMASFRRRSCQQPLRANGFYSFVEDWDRSPKACGHTLR
jgi:hypothetical protein